MLFIDKGAYTNYQSEHGEQLHDYMQCFTSNHNELPNLSQKKVINTFMRRVRCQELVHKINRKEVSIDTRTLLDLSISYADSES